jgi:hypothetical protein
MLVGREEEGWFCKRQRLGRSVVRFTDTFGLKQSVIRKYFPREEWRCGGEDSITE